MGTEGIRLPEMHTGEVDGVAAYWAPDDGPIHAALMFDGGVCVEPPELRGIQHLIEHLVMSAVGPQAYEHNGQVDLRRTMFTVRGDRDEVQSFLDTVVAGLRDVPLDREALEPNVLEAEAQGRTSTTMTGLLAMLYGAAGPGLTETAELALAGLPSEVLTRWLQQRMHGGRAAFWCTADPSGFDLSGLPAGPRGEPWRLPDQIDGPGWMGGNGSGFAAIAVVPRTTATSTMIRVLREHVLDALRTTAGVSYAVDTAYEALTPWEAVVGLFVDAAPDRQVDARDWLLEALDQFVADGPAARWLTLDRQRLVRVNRERSAGAGIAMRAAMGHLLGEDDPTSTDWVAEYEQLTPADLASTAEAWLAAASWMMADGAPMPPWRRLPRLRLWDEDPVAGRDLEPVGTVGYRLVVGEDGVSVVHGQDRIATAAFGQLVAVEAWDDGSRLLHTRNGNRVAFDASLWREGPEFVAWLDAATGHAPRVERGQRPDR